MDEQVLSDLGRSGADLYRGIASRWDLRPDELRVLLEACREADLVDKLAALADGVDLVVTGSTGQVTMHPVVAELRQHRTVLSGLLKRLSLPDSSGESPRGVQQRAAAAARWGKRPA